MNLMFRKNFREGASGANRTTAIGKLTSKIVRSPGKRSRDMSSGFSQNDTELHYRTHILFSPASRSGQQSVHEERCGPVTGAADSYPLSSSPSSAQLHQSQSPSTSCDQPLVERSIPMSILKWHTNSTTTNNSNRNDARHTPLAARQGRSNDQVSLSNLDRDCFMIPFHSLDRFLPAGIQLPPLNTNASGTSPLSVLEVSDPKICVLAHLMSPLEPIDPVLESPLSHPLFKQRAAASELLNDVQQANSAIGGMLLANMEKNSEFPFISYYVINTSQTDPTNFYMHIRTTSLAKFEPRNLRYTAAHTLDLYYEVASICRPPLAVSPNEVGNFKKTQTSSTCYIINVFKVFEGDDGERFERNWLYWTGARMIYRYLPRSAGLRRIALHKSASQKGDKMYLLVCECADLLKDLTATAVLITALRARLCGHIGLYKPIQVF